MSFQHFCRLAGELHIPDVRTLWRFKQYLRQGGLGRRALFGAVSQQLQAHDYIPRGVSNRGRQHRAGAGDTKIVPAISLRKPYPKSTAFSAQP